VRAGKERYSKPQLGSSYTVFLEDSLVVSQVLMTHDHDSRFVTRFRPEDAVGDSAE
jgi:hypothetical protein